MESLFRNILVATDGSLQSKISLQMAILMSKLFGSQVTLIHVVSNELPTLAGQMYSPWEDFVPVNAATYQFPRALGMPRTKENVFPDEVIREVIERYRENGRMILAESASLFSRAGITVNQKLTEGTDTAETLIEEAETGSYDLIVMGNSGGEENELDHHLGSVAKKVSYRIKAPVLVVREKTELRKILIPVDGSPKEKSALQKILTLSKAAGSKIILLHVQEASSLRLRPEVKEIGHQILNNASELFKGLSFEQMLASGDPAKVIIQTAEQTDVDLIALAGGGLGSLKGFLLGSVTDHVLHQAAVPVLVI